MFPGNLVSLFKLAQTYRFKLSLHSRVAAQGDTNGSIFTLQCEPFEMFFFPFFSIYHAEKAVASRFFLGCCDELPAGTCLAEHADQTLTELFVLVAVDDEVERGVDGGQKVGEGDHGVHPGEPVLLHVQV